MRFTLFNLIGSIVLIGIICSFFLDNHVYELNKINKHIEKEKMESKIINMQFKYFEIVRKRELTEHETDSIIKS